MSVEKKAHTPNKSLSSALITEDAFHNINESHNLGLQAAAHLDPENDIFKSVDRLAHAMLGRMTYGISPASLMLAYFDWALHLADSPGKQLSLAHKALHNNLRFLVSTTQSCIEPHTVCPSAPIASDVRFRSDDWQKPPFNSIYQSFLLIEEWWKNATTDVEGVSRHHEEIISFVARQFLDMMAPSNFIWFNPTLLKATYEQGGANLIQGTINLMQDLEKQMSSCRPNDTEEFLPGKNVAVTAGTVIYRNTLIELIQYHPTTANVQAEPVLIVPAWIMKYYILDLSPHNSFVKYLVDQGHTVFMISWRNPTSEDRDLSMDDYLDLGILSALNVIRSIAPSKKINAVGYCLGGTLLSIAAAYLAREEKNILNTITLLASQIDFTEAGELTLFIDESQVHFIEDLMWAQGYMDSKQMAGTFQILRSNDLIWSHLLHEYLMGKRILPNDLMSWSKDATRMPYRMHSEYLRRLFLNNELFQGRYKIKDLPVVLSDIHVPIFSLATEKDHIAPWRSVYKINLLAEAEVTFALTSGGHNAGIVSEPGHKKRSYRISLHKAGEPYIGPDAWYSEMPVHKGSWWPNWAKWLTKHNSGKNAPPEMGAPEKGYAPLIPAPGTYVLECPLNDLSSKKPKYK